MISVVSTIVWVSSSWPPDCIPLLPMINVIVRRDDSDEGEREERAESEHALLDRTSGLDDLVRDKGF